MIAYIPAVRAGRKALIIGIACLVVSTVTTAQRTAHSSRIEGAYPDGKGEVMVTLDEKGNAKFWSLKDGSLLTTVNKETPEWNIKILRYRVQHYDFLGRGLSQDWEEFSKIDSFWSAFKASGEVVTRVRLGPNSNPSFEQHRPSGKIVVNTRSGFPDNLKTQIHMVTPVPGAANKRGNLKRIAEVEGWSYAYFSHKGTWLWLSRCGMLVHTETGKVVDYGKLPPKVNDYKYAFNADETQLSMITKDGMIVIDIATGKQIREVSLPRKIRQEKDFNMYPCSDGASFVYAGSKAGTIPGRAWLVKESGATELVD